MITPIVAFAIIFAVTGWVLFFAFILHYMKGVHELDNYEIEECYGKIKRVFKEENEFIYNIDVVIKTKSMTTIDYKAIISKDEYNVGDYVFISNIGKDFKIEYKINELDLSAKYLNALSLCERNMY